jgi:murein DD-endopeptidase MepM/ murein hydrolase activator NlpD
LRRSSAIFALLSALVAAVLLLAPAGSLAVTEDDLEETERKAQEAREAAEASEAEAERQTEQVREIDQVIAEIEGDVAELRTAIDEVKNRRAVLEADIAQLEARIAEKEQEIAATQAELENRRSLLAERVQTTYKNGDLYFLQLLFEAKSLRDLVERTSYVQIVMESDERIAAGLTETRNDLQLIHAQLQRDKQEVAAKREEVLAQEQRLSDLEAQERVKLVGQQQARNQKQGLVDESEENAARMRALAEELEAESARIAAELREQQTAGEGVYNGVMAWPVPSSTRITSPFGWRVHPIFGSRRFHSGIDIGAPSGADVVASGSGVVLKASYGWNGGYGNQIWIDHGDGLVSTYNHLLAGSFSVSSGEAVGKGQRIAGIGSTGYSTGPHLHFETRVNGEPVDPMLYLK